MIAYRDVKIAVAVWAAVLYVLMTLYGWPPMPSSYNHGLKLQSLMKVVN